MMKPLRCRCLKRELVDNETLTRLSLKLLLGKNDLDGSSVVSVRDRMVHYANSANSLSNDLSLFKSSNISGVTDHKRSLGSLFSNSDSGNLVSIEKNLVNLSVEHVGTSVDGAKTREGFGKTSKTENGVQEGRLTILAKTLNVQVDSLDGIKSGHGEEFFISVKGNGVTHEINSVILKLELLEKSLHVVVFYVEISPGFLVLFVKFVKVDVEVSASLFLEKTHKRRLKSL